MQIRHASLLQHAYNSLLFFRIDDTIDYKMLFTTGQDRLMLQNESQVISGLPFGMPRHQVIADHSIQDKSIFLVSGTTFMVLLPKLVNIYSRRSGPIVRSYKRYARINTRRLPYRPKKDIPHPISTG